MVQEGYAAAEHMLLGCSADGPIAWNGLLYDACYVMPGIQ
mgnify:CR=1 FL=1